MKRCTQARRSSQPFTTQAPICLGMRRQPALHALPPAAVRTAGAAPAAQRSGAVQHNERCSAQLQGSVHLVSAPCTPAAELTQPTPPPCAGKCRGVSKICVTHTCNTTTATHTYTHSLLQTPMCRGWHTRSGTTALLTTPARACNCRLALHCIVGAAQTHNTPQQHTPTTHTAHRNSRARTCTVKLGGFSSQLHLLIYVCHKRALLWHRSSDDPTSASAHALHTHTHARAHAHTHTRARAHAHTHTRTRTRTHAHTQDKPAAVSAQHRAELTRPRQPDLPQSCRSLGAYAELH